MNEIDAKSVRSGLGFFKVGWGATPFFQPDQLGNPPFTQYEPNYNIGDSTSEISIGLGFKTLQYEGEEPICSYGDLISITPNFENATVEGEMRGMVQTYSFEGGVSTIVVEVYYSDMRALTIPYENKWSIRFQLNDGSNIVQNPDSLYIAKLSVYDGGSFANGYAEFIPTSTYYPTTEIIVNTPFLLIEIVKNYFKGQVNVQEDMSDIHKPWLGTTVSVARETEKVTIESDLIWGDYYNGGTGFTRETTETREPISTTYSHTFTSFDFDSASPDFNPAPEGSHSPSRQSSLTPDYVGFFTITYETRSEYKTFIDAGVVLVTVFESVIDEGVNLKLRITDVTPPSFFEPPTA